MQYLYGRTKLVLFLYSHTGEENVLKRHTWFGVTQKQTEVWFKPTLKCRKQYNLKQQIQMLLLKVESVLFVALDEWSWRLFFLTKNCSLPSSIRARAISRPNVFEAELPNAKWNLAIENLLWFVWTLLGSLKSEERSVLSFEPKNDPTELSLT